MLLSDRDQYWAIHRIQVSNRERKKYTAASLHWIRPQASICFSVTLLPIFFLNLVPLSTHLHFSLKHSFECCSSPSLYFLTHLYLWFSSFPSALLKWRDLETVLLWVAGWVIELQVKGKSLSDFTWNISACQFSYLPGSTKLILAFHVAFDSCTQLADRYTRPHSHVYTHT